MRHIFELFLLFIVLTGLPDWYIYRTYIRKWKKKAMRMLYWVPSIVLLLGMVYVFGSFKAKPESMNLLGIFLITFLTINVPKIVYSLLSLLFRAILPKSKGQIAGNCIAGASALFVMGYILYGALFGTENFQIRETTIYSKDLPKGFENYRIVQISDIHCGSWAGDTQALQKAVNLINAQEPDLIVFTGDLVNNIATELDEFMPVLSQLKAKDGVYSVLGNHDYAMYIPWESPEKKEENLLALKQKQADMNWKLLNNRHVKLYQNGDSLALIGVENCGRPPFPNYAKLPEALEGTEGMFKVLLSHDPSSWRREVLPETDIQLTLSGHTHAMQTKIFGFSPAVWVYPEYEGLYTEGGQMLYVNIGLGHLMYPLRLGAWPEITLLTLKREE
ncbi:MAG: metallophosphoesterase [Bacteroidaceae bacterium]|nr:metallophosphoesterase [Bacteroidaceae bacterium]